MEGNILNWDSKRPNSSLKFDTDFVCAIELFLCISFLNTTARGRKRMICVIFKLKILLAFFACPGSDIHGQY